MHDLELKQAMKQKRVRRKSDKPRKPSGFASPVTVSDAMYDFLANFGVEKNTQIARTEVTKYIHRYIKDNNLQNESNKREILPNKVLQNLLGEPKEDTLKGNVKCYNFLKLQSYMSQHFPKKVVA